MVQTRRGFLAATAGLAAALAARPGFAATGPARLSLPAFCKDEARVASFRRGIAAMKALPASDYHSYFFWAATHAYSKALLKAELARDPKLARFDRKKYWNQCPHFDQCSADFVIWHRAYLHFFERALRAAANDPDLALPYWDYSQADQRTMPAIFVPEFLDDAKKEKNPLYHKNREKSFWKGLVEISPMVALAEKTMAAAAFFHQPDQPGFGGDNLDGDHTQQGLLEQRPHNDIHTAVGGAIGSANGAMAEITTAAFDPVFWVHHANVDRLWAQWASTPGRSWGPVPSTEWFEARPFLFVDADGSDVRVSRREAIGMLAAYDVDYPHQLAVPAVRVAAPPQVAMASAAPSTMPPKARELLADNRPLTVTPDNPGARTIGESAGGGGRNTSYANERAAPHTLDAPELYDPNARVLLELSLSVARVPSSGFAAYLDCAGQARATEPVGLIDIFGATHGHAEMENMPGMAGKPFAQRFDVTRIVRASAGPFTLRIEPYDLLVAKSGAAPRARADALTIEAMRFIVVS